MSRVRSFIPKSMRLRVIVYVFTTSLVVMVLISRFISMQISLVTEKLVEEKLLEQAQRVSSYIEHDWIGRPELDLPRGYRAYFSSGESGQFAVLDGSGNILFKSKNFVRGHIENTFDKGGKHYFHFEIDDGKSFIGLKYDYLFEGKIYPIYVMENEGEFSGFMRSIGKNFLNEILLYGIPLLIIQALVILFIFQRTLKPMLNAAREAQQIKYDNLSFRLNEDNVYIEVLPLIQSINKGLARLEKSAEVQKFFIANAAHELRTPIAILKARISSLKDEKEVYILNNDLRNINRLIGQMLDISRLNLAEAAPKTDVSLNAITKRACEDMGALFISEGKELSLEEIGHNQIIYGNEDTVFRAVLNLLENALKHTPEKTAVEVIVDIQKITVRDYGVPIPDEDKAKIFEKFEKRAASASTKGSGLGLAIVKKAAEIHDGVVTLVTREDGNDFVLDFS